jgi:hypothetical protein
MKLMKIFERRERKMMNLKLTTEEEREKIISKLADTLIDHVNAEADDMARECIKDLFDLNFDKDDELEVTYSFKFSALFLKILRAAVRRENAKKGNKK